MVSVYNGKIKLTISGESHGKKLKAALTGLPAGCGISENYIAAQMARRAPGNSAVATQRTEPDAVKILSGIKNGVTTGEKIVLEIENIDVNKKDYGNTLTTPRPSHADYAAYVKYGTVPSGGGHFSGRLTAPLVAVGAVCSQILNKKGIFIGGHIYNIGKVYDTAFNYANIKKSDLLKLSGTYFATNSAKSKKDMEKLIKSVKAEGNSIGGSVEVAVIGVPPGIGNHMFGGIENVLSALIYAVPAVKGVSFGAGFDFSTLTGSIANDAYVLKNKKIVTLTNNCGGITGGMSNGMPIIVKAAIKPTPTISMPQNTVDLLTGKPKTVTFAGRHDPCIAVRALPAVEAAVAIGITELLLRDNAL